MDVKLTFIQIKLFLQWVPWHSELLRGKIKNDKKDQIACSVITPFFDKGFATQGPDRPYIFQLYDSLSTKPSDFVILQQQINSMKFLLTSLSDFRGKVPRNCAAVVEALRDLRMVIYVFRYLRNDEPAQKWRLISDQIYKKL
jgi:hypothetical protein